MGKAIEAIVAAFALVCILVGFTASKYNSDVNLCPSRDFKQIQCLYSENNSHESPEDLIDDAIFDAHDE